jgi:hypothetical protein
MATVCESVKTAFHRSSVERLSTTLAFRTRHALGLSFVSCGVSDATIQSRATLASSHPSGG